MTDEINDALQNLKEIKNGDNATGSSEAAAATVSTADAVNTAAATPPTTDNEALNAARRVVREAFAENDWLSEALSLDNITVAVTEWNRRLGQAKYNQRVTEHVFGQRVPESKIAVEAGEYSVLLATGVYENDMNWRDTVLHEIAHCFAHAVYDSYPESSKGGSEFSSHGRAWKSIARKIGADPTATSQRENKDLKPYRLACGDGCWCVGKVRRSKKIQKPWSRYCKECDTPCVSYDAGNEMPSEPGTCAVESIKWSDKQSYLRSDKQL